MDRLYITHVHTEVKDADVFFPEIDPTVWTPVNVSETHTDPETGFDFEFVVYEKTANLTPCNSEKHSAAGERQ